MYIRGGQTLDCGQLFGRVRPHFGLWFWFLFAASVRQIALRLTAFLGSTYLCSEALSQKKIFKSYTEAV
jgi:hypothetical protein